MNRHRAVVVFIALSLLLALFPTPDAWAVAPTSIPIYSMAMRWLR